MLITRAGHDAEVLLDRRPALHGADRDVGLAHPAVDDRAELGHLQQRRRRARRRSARRPGSPRASPARRRRRPSAARCGRGSRTGRSARRRCPLASSSFSLKRTVLNAAGRAPIAPTRRPRRPLHDAADAGEPLAGPARTRRESGASVCSVVSEYGMPYCFRLLQADILPQKLSRRSCDRHRAGVSGVAWIRTGTSRSAMRSVSAIAALVAEVRQRDDDAVDLVAVRAGTGRRTCAPRRASRRRRTSSRPARARRPRRRPSAGRRSSPRGRSWPGDPGRSPGCRRSVRWSLVLTGSRLTALGSGSGGVTRDPAESPEP